MIQIYCYHVFVSTTIIIRPIGITGLHLILLQPENDDVKNSSGYSKHNSKNANNNNNLWIASSLHENFPNIDELDYHCYKFQIP